MPKIIEATCTVKRVVQVAAYEPEEAFVAIKLAFAEGEEMDQSDLDSALDKARDAVYKRLGIEDDSDVVSRETSVVLKSTDTQIEESVEAVKAGARMSGRRGGNPTPASAPVNQDAPSTVQATTAGSQAVTAEAVSSTANPSNRRRPGAAANPIQPPASPENTSAASVAASGSRRPGGSAQQATATSAAAAQSGAVSDWKLGDISKACSALAAAKSPKETMMLLAEFGVERANDLPKDQYDAFMVTYKTMAA